MPFLRYCVEQKCDNDTHNVLLLGAYGHLNVWYLSMASYISMQNLNEISYVMNLIHHAIFEILSGKEV